MDVPTQKNRSTMGKTLEYRIGSPLGGWVLPYIPEEGLLNYSPVAGELFITTNGKAPPFVLSLSKPALSLSKGTRDAVHGSTVR